MESRLCLGLWMLTDRMKELIEMFTGSLEEFLVHLNCAQHNFVEYIAQWCPIKPINLKGIVKYECNWKQTDVYPRDVNNLLMSWHKSFFLFTLIKYLFSLTLYTAIHQLDEFIFIIIISWKKLLRMARNHRILHMPIEWINELLLVVIT